MDSEQRHQDLLRLNALVDGELPPAERADARRAAGGRARSGARLCHAGAAEGGDCRRGWTRRRRWPCRRRSGGLGRRLVACLAAPGRGGLGSRRHARGRRCSRPTTSSRAMHEAPDEAPTAITLASLPAGTTIPRLDTAGLKLVSLDLNPGHVPIFTARYRGPHGCRLDLRAWPVGRAGARRFPAAAATAGRWATSPMSWWRTVCRYGASTSSPAPPSCRPG